MNKEINNSLILTLLLALIVSFAKILELIFSIDLSILGVLPRQYDGIVGILSAPLIHGDMNHLISNLFPLMLASFILFSYYKEISIEALIGIWIGTGIMMWIFGRPSWHIGASGVLYGLNFFILISGIIRKEVKPIALAMLILLFNQGLINGMVPYDAHISFEGHISGAVVGSVFAIIFKNKAKTEQIVYPWMLEEDDDEDGLWNIKKHFNQDEE